MKPVTPQFGQARSSRYEGSVRAKRSPRADNDNTPDTDWLEFERWYFNERVE